MLHGDLILVLKKFIQKTWTSVEMITVDHLPEGQEKPPKINQHRPDVYAKRRNDSSIIGEAKTSKDFESARSQEQIISFLKYADEYGCIFCLAVPSAYQMTAISRLNYLMTVEALTVEAYVIHSEGVRRV